MVLNGLGFANRALYLTPNFFRDKPVERLIGEGIGAEHLNDDVLGRVLGGCPKSPSLGGRGDKTPRFLVLPRQGRHEVKKSRAVLRQAQEPVSFYSR
jgi:hypothetical protein